MLLVKKWPKKLLKITLTLDTHHQNSIPTKDSSSSNRAPKQPRSNRSVHEVNLSTGSWQKELNQVRVSKGESYQSHLVTRWHRNRVRDWARPVFCLGLPDDIVLRKSLVVGGHPWYPGAVMACLDGDIVWWMRCRYWTDTENRDAFGKLISNICPVSLSSYVITIQPQWMKISSSKR